MCGLRALEGARRDLRTEGMVAYQESRYGTTYEILDLLDILGKSGKPILERATSRFQIPALSRSFSRKVIITIGPLESKIQKWIFALRPSSLISQGDYSKTFFFDFFSDHGF